MTSRHNVTSTLIAIHCNSLCANCRFLKQAFVLQIPISKIILLKNLRLARCQKGDQMWIVNFCVNPARRINNWHFEGARESSQDTHELWIMGRDEDSQFTFCTHPESIRCESSPSPRIYNSRISWEIHSWHFRVHERETYVAYLRVKHGVATSVIRK